MLVGASRPGIHMFIVLEGLDGAGTTTQTARLADALRAAGREVVTTREPSDGPVGTLIRHMLSRRVVLPGGERAAPETIAALFAGDRIDHLRATVEPALARGAVVISDRYVHSSLAYQGQECDRDWVLEANRNARDADLTIFVDLPVDTCLERIGTRNAARDIYETRAVLERVRAGYEAAIELRPNGVVRVDGTGTIDEVHAAIMRAVDAASA